MVMLLSNSEIIQSSKWKYTTENTFRTSIKSFWQMWLMLVWYSVFWHTVLSLIADHPSSLISPSPSLFCLLLSFCSFWVTECVDYVPELATIQMSVLNDLIPAQHVWDLKKKKSLHCVLCVYFCVWIRTHMCLCQCLSEKIWWLN